MAEVLSGSLNTPSYDGRYVRFSWSAKQSVSGNYSIVSWTLKGAGSAPHTYYMAGPVKLWRTGVGWIFNKTSRFQLKNGTSIGSGSFRVNHNSEGEGSFEIELQAAIYSYSINKTNKGSWILKTIPRATEPSIVYMSGSTCVLGTPVTIKTPRKSTAFDNTVTYTCGSASGTIGTDLGDSVKWTPPISLLSALGKTSGNITITCKTYNGSTLIGSDTATLKVVAPATTTPTVEYTSGDIVPLGNEVIIKTPRKASAYKHTLTYSMGDASGTIASNVDTSYTWKPPVELVSQFEGITDTLTVTCKTYYEDILIGTKTVKVNVLVPATTPMVVYSSGSNVLLGETVTINMPRESSTFVHTLKYALGDITGVIGTGLGASKVWEVPMVLLSGLIATTGNVTVSCETYSDDILIGTRTVDVVVRRPEGLEQVDDEMGDFELVDIKVDTSDDTLDITIVNKGDIETVDLAVFIYDKSISSYRYVGTDSFEKDGLNTVVCSYVLDTILKALLAQSAKIKLIFINNTTESIKDILAIGYCIGKF